MIWNYLTININQVMVIMYILIWFIRIALWSKSSQEGPVHNCIWLIDLFGVMKWVLICTWEGKEIMQRSSTSTPLPLPLCHVMVAEWLACVPAGHIVLGSFFHSDGFEILTWLHMLTQPKLGTMERSWRVRAPAHYWSHHPLRDEWSTRNMSLATYT